MSDPGKGSNRRPAQVDNYESEHERIFGKKTFKPGRRSYVYVPGEGFVERVPPPQLSSDLRFEGTFVSPVTGEVISNKHKLNDHNKRNKVEQVLPGMRQDQAAVRADNHDKAFGKQAKAERIEAVKRALESG